MKNVLIALFDSEEKVMHATRTLCDKKIPIFDVFTPYPIHELEVLLGIRRSRLPIVCFIAGVLGFSMAMGFQLWVFNLDWPIIVGGKPFNSVPAFMPVAFEVTVLIGGLVTVAAFFFKSRLFPGRRTSIPDPKVTDDQFALSILHSDASLDSEEVRELLLNIGALSVSEREIK